MDLQLQGKQVVVAGGTRGIGLAIARGFLAEGSQVHIIARTANAVLLENLREEYGNTVYMYSCDVTDADALKQIADDIQKNTAGGIDVVVANVGSGRSVPDALPAAENWDRVWDTNFTSALNCARIFENRLNNPGGSMLFISSIAGVEFIGAPTDYTVAKAALVALSKNLARKLAPGIRVNAVAPGNIYFEGGSWQKRMQENPEKIHAFIQEKVPMKRFGRPEEIADLVLYLSSDKASFITGTCIVSDGGQTARI